MMKVVLEMEVSPGEHDASGKKELRGRWEESKSRVGGVMKSAVFLVTQIYRILKYICCSYHKYMLHFPSSVNNAQTETEHSGACKQYCSSIR